MTSPNLELAASNMLLNAKLQIVMECLMDVEPEVAMGVLAVAQARTFRRVTVKHKIIDGPRKKMILKRVLTDLENKIRFHGFQANANAQHTPETIPEKT